MVCLVFVVLALPGQVIPQLIVSVWFCVPVPSVYHLVQNGHESRGEDNVAKVMFIHPHPSRQESTGVSACKAWKLREGRREEKLIEGCPYWEPGKHLAKN